MRVTVNFPNRTEQEVSESELTALRRQFVATDGDRLDLTYGKTVDEPRAPANFIIVMVNIEEIRRDPENFSAPDAYVYVDDSMHTPRIMRAEAYRDMLLSEASARQELRKRAAKGLPYV